MPLYKTGYTNEQAQDAVGSILTDTSTIDLVYNDPNNTIEANVIPSGIDRNTLSGGALSIANGGTGSNTQNFVDLTTNQVINGNKTFNNSLNIANTTNSTSTTTGALIIGGGVGVNGDINVASQVTSLRWLSNSTLSAVPSLNTRSIGTRLVLFNSLSAGDVDHAIGVEPNHVWFSIPNSNSARGFKWYAGISQIMRLAGSAELQLPLSNSSLTVAGITNSTSTTTGAITVVGGVGIGGNINIGGATTSTSYNLSTLNTAPASATSPGITGEIKYTSTHIYVCIATNTWVRSVLSTW